MRALRWLVGAGLLAMAGCSELGGGDDDKPVCEYAQCGPGSVGCVEEDGAARCECWSGYTGPTCEQCSPGYAKAGDKCVATCGDGQVNGSETCDDGNGSANDGCSPTCTPEAGWECHGEPSACTHEAACGDRRVDGAEGCDDGNNNPGDGCSAACAVESGYGCRGAPSVCEPMACGDRQVTGSETCDDGNTHENDGCSAYCVVEHGYTCTGTPSVCTKRCGDGVIAVNEVCDDGNTANGDGCTSACAMEPTFTCTGEPSVCTSPCGNGVIEGGEYCDDHNRAAGDGCSPGCGVEEAWHCAGVPSACTRIPEVPVIQGEASAGHADVLWTWNVPAATVRFRHSLDGNLPVDAAATVTSLAVPSLAAGTHVFKLQACNSEGSCSEWAAFTTVVETLLPRAGYAGPWVGVQRAVAMTPRGHAAPLTCPACFSAAAATATQNLASTQAQLDGAILAGADAVELVVTDVGGTARVNLHDSASSAALADVLDHPGLRGSDVLVSLRLDETTDATRLVGTVLGLLEARRADLARNGRPVLLRAAHNRRAALLEAKQRLTERPFLRHYVRLVEVFDGSEAAGLPAFQAFIGEAGASGFDFVELPHAGAGLVTNVNYAHSLGLGVLLGGIPATGGDVFLGAMREDADGVATAYPLAQAREVLVASSSLAYVNTWNQASAATHVDYLRTDATVHTAPMNTPGAPASRSHAQGEGFFGTTLAFDGASHQALTLWDGDAPGGHGVLVTALVRFGSLDLGVGGTQSILSKAQAGGWCLELARAGDAPAVLHFGVFHNAWYEYAELPAALLNTTDTFFIVGAYDGAGDVQLWVDGSATGVTTPGSFAGAGISSDVPITVGADPEPAGVTRMWFTGEVQQAMVQTWRHR